MDTIRKIKLHPTAKEFLFENYAIVRRIFSDVLGQLEIDYISIAMINDSAEVFFVSSNPSIEQNLIEKSLWSYDPIYQDHFIYQNDHTLWSKHSPLMEPALLKQYKQRDQKLIDGVSIPIDYGVYRAILSFGFKKMNTLIDHSSNDYEKLLSIGRYCLNKISSLILFPDRKKCNKKPQLKLIINNLG